MNVARSLATLAAVAGLASVALAALPSAAADSQPTPAPEAAPAPQPGAAPSSPSGEPAEPDGGWLGTVEVPYGSDGGLLPPLPKLAVVPVVSTGAADSLVGLVVRRDMELSGQFDVMDDSLSPPGPFLHATPLDLVAWRAQGAEDVVRVFAEPAPNDSTRTRLVGEAYFTPTRISATAAAEAGPAFRVALSTATTEVRAASHRLVDLLLGALTGRPGGFASEMVYAEKVGRWHRVFAIDSDGFDLRPIGPSDATAVSPTFGPNGHIFYALSRDYSPFRLVFGPDATPVPLSIPGSILGVAFSSDHTRIGLTVMDEGRSALWVGNRGAVEQTEAPPFANHPVFGPLGKMAYVAGTPVQRIYVGNRPISPPGFMASAPVFCDTPLGLLVIYTVGVGTGADIVASDSNGGNVRRLTQHEGANTYAACSPDGRLISFFSTGKIKRGAGQDEGAGLFIMPIARPSLAKKISSEVGESLRWEALPPPTGVTSK